MNSKHFKVELDSVQTNILMIYIQGDEIVAKDVLNRLNTVHVDDEYKVCVRASSRNPKVIRVVLYHEITDPQVELAIKKFKLVIEEFDKTFA